MFLYELAIEVDKHSGEVAAAAHPEMVGVGPVTMAMTVHPAAFSVGASLVDPSDRCKRSEAMHRPAVEECR